MGDKNGEEYLLPVRISFEEFKLFRIVPGLRVSDLLDDLTKDCNLQLCKMLREAGGRVIATQLIHEDTPIDDIDDIRWNVREPCDCDLWLVDIRNEFNIFFNDFTRLTSGYPMHHLVLYSDLNMQVYTFEKLIRECIGLSHDDPRLRLYGCEPGSRQVQFLDPMSQAAAFIPDDDPGSPSFFQFMAVPGYVNCRYLGVTASEKRMVMSFGVMGKPRKYQVFLQGTSLFYQQTLANETEDQTKKVKLQEFAHLERCKINDPSHDKRANKWTVFIEPPKLPSYFAHKYNHLTSSLTLYFTSQKSAFKWHGLLIRASLPREIITPVTMEALRKIPMEMYCPIPYQKDTAVVAIKSRPPQPKRQTAKPKVKNAGCDLVSEQDVSFVKALLELGLQERRDDAAVSSLAWLWNQPSFSKLINELAT